MDRYLFVARSVTHARQMADALERSGIYAKVKRAGAAVTGNGCGYTLEVSGAAYRRAAQLTETLPVRPTKVYRVDQNGRREVVT